jgi:tRNA nucleotidyltransferase (CCA-adding enzyme)
VNAVPDVLWGQLYKSQKSLKRMLQRHDFPVIRDDVWSDGGASNVLLFETEKRVLPRIRRHLGPPLAKSAECDRFLHKHLGATNTISGPRVEKGRWVVEIKRKYREVVNLLTERLRDGGRNIGVANLISQAISEGFEILINEEILDLYSSDRAFARHLTEYLHGRPRWLQ